MIYFLLISFVNYLDLLFSFLRKIYLDSSAYLQIAISLYTKEYASSKGSLHEIFPTQLPSDIQIQD